MTFYFGNKEGDPLMAKINLRAISACAKQWDHPMKGLLKYAEAMRAVNGDILKLSKKDIERYTLSLFGVALMSDINEEWWTNIPPEDPPDGLIMTLREIKSGVHMGFMREVEVVQHRDEPAQIIKTITNKMVENNYDANSLLACLVLSGSFYNFRDLSAELRDIISTTKHVFVIFPGMMITDEMLVPKEWQTTYTMVQLLPVFQHVTFDLRPYLDDFGKRYDLGQESRLINGNEVHYGTTNPKYMGNR